MDTTRGARRQTRNRIDRRKTLHVQGSDSAFHGRHDGGRKRTSTKTSHADAKQLAAAVASTDTYLDAAVKKLSAVKDMKLQRTAAAITAQPR